MGYKTGFEQKVITHLQYIKKKQEEHDIKIEKLIESFGSQRYKCDKRFDKIQSKVDRAEGFAKGAMIVAGMIGGLVGWISRLFGGN